MKRIKTSDLSSPKILQSRFFQIFNVWMQIFILCGLNNFELLFTRWVLFPLYLMTFSSRIWKIKSSHNTSFYNKKFTVMHETYFWYENVWVCYHPLGDYRNFVFQSGICLSTLCQATCLRVLAHFLASALCKSLHQISSYATNIKSSIVLFFRSIDYFWIGICKTIGSLAQLMSLQLFLLITCEFNVV